MKWIAKGFGVLLLIFSPVFGAEKSSRPNVIWIVGEDLGPELGCYGDENAITPNIDRLAKEGARFTHCFTHAPVCAPSRHGLITGQYPNKTGAMHMRSQLVNAPQTFTKLLRDSGYFVAWPGKTDFNFQPGKDFADSREPWRKGARPEAEKPFFGYINLGETHESQVRNDGNKFAENTEKLTPGQRRDPANMKLPPFWPDSPEVRRELANYYDLVTAIDYRVGEVLDWIDKNGMKENTVVVFFGDHGRGMPRYKRWCYDTGTRVPLIVRWPSKITPGVRNDLVEFVDLPTTVLTLSGGKLPADFDGVAFLNQEGNQSQPARKYVHSHRDYMDEAYDRIRSVRDSRWRYVRNFEPQISYSLENIYMERGKTMQVWRAFHADGKLNAVQSIHFSPFKPKEELYDSESDPFEINNLVDDPAHAEKLAELRTECDRWLAATNDKAAMPVEELIAKQIIHPRKKSD